MGEIADMMLDGTLCYSGPMDATIKCRHCKGTGHI